MKLASSTRGKSRTRRNRLGLETLEIRNLLSTFVVTNANDAGAGSLRDAITKANNNPGYDTINFNITAGSKAVKTITLKSELPDICDRITIDGFSQGGASYCASPLIEINGNGKVCDVLDVKAGSSTIRGLAVFGALEANIHLECQGWNTVYSCFVGVKANGTTAGIASDVYGNLAENEGIFIDNVGYNTIGSTVSGGGNLISGNGDDGIDIEGWCAKYNTIVNNFIGTDVTGKLDLGNLDDGIDISCGASYITIGGTDSCAGNLISANGDNGIEITGRRFWEPASFFGGDDEDLQCFKVTIQGNYIGVDVTGKAALGNAYNGIYVDGKDVLIGGVATGAGNIISANGCNGIFVNDCGTGVVIQANLIGVGKGKCADLGNVYNGVEIDGENNLVGGTVKKAGNTIAFNGCYGVEVDDDNNSIRLNSIYANGCEGIELGWRVACDVPAPTLAYAYVEGNFVNVEGIVTLPGWFLNLQPKTPVLIDIYCTDTTDEVTGVIAQGKTYLGSVTAVTDIFGNATFKGKFVLPKNMDDCVFITATTNFTTPELRGQTSEFSAPVEIF